jgi:hypothetical protein
LKIKVAVAALNVWILYTAAPLTAHHSFASMFDINKPIRIEGKVTQLTWANPHAFVDVAVTDNKGATLNWRVELPSLNDIYYGGFNRNMILVGSDVAVGGYGARSGERFIGAAALTMKATGKSLAIPVEQSWKIPGPSEERFYAGASVQLTGRVVSIDRVNPIPSVRISVILSGGQTEEWLVETASTSTLEQIGWKETSIIPGDVIQVGGKSAMSGSRKVFALSVVVIAKDGKALASPMALLNSTPLK